MHLSFSQKSDSLISGETRLQHITTATSLSHSPCSGLHLLFQAPGLLARRRKPRTWLSRSLVPTAAATRHHQTPSSPAAGRWSGFVGGVGWPLTRGLAAAASCSNPSPSALPSWCLFNCLDGIHVTIDLLMDSPSDFVAADSRRAVRGAPGSTEQSLRSVSYSSHLGCIVIVNFVGLPWTSWLSGLGAYGRGGGQVVDMTLALVLVMVEQEGEFMGVEQVIVAVVDTILIQDRCPLSIL
ncbi:hypothetical protein SASPL_137889 [Salvia splendens]|uniref:Uncharacterized protein n=1 Tax=Salvia splendens TaxID=180675 RepID=A0A8X8WUH9_SALSN|nr:hypothetical protein SASPL_137889 [Salvia splendens]